MSEEKSQSESGAGDRTVSPRSRPAAHTMICPACSATYPANSRFCPLDGSVLRPIGSDTEELVGTVIDERYYLVEKLGEGGMGAVYLGEHVLTQRRCAVKVVSRTLAADPDAFGRFVREATNAGRISHPHVATIYDFGKTDDGLLYLAMELVEGEPLSTLLERENALAPARAVEIAQQVAAAVGAAHELGIVHRDLKPGNILVARDRKGGDLVKVVDFGIARVTHDERQHLTRTGFVIGTPEYMSPEQLIGDPVDARTDIYALGCILYQMLTGSLAFGGSTARLITRRLTERPPRPREVNASIPKPLDDVVVTALGRSPQDRYQTMEELREALLAAPSQPVTTGPRRLAAWLGLGGGRDDDDEDEKRAVAETAESPLVESPIEPTLTAVPAATLDESAELLAEVAAPDDVDVVPVAAESSEVRKSADDSLTLPTWDWDTAAAAAPPRRSLWPRIGVGVGAVVALLAAVLALRTPEPEADEVTVPAPSETTEPPPAVPAIVPDTVLARARDALRVAEEEIVAEQYVAAIVRLRGVESSLAELSAEFPQLADTQLLIDSARAQLSNIERRCNALKRLAAERNEPPPVCEVS